MVDERITEFKQNINSARTRIDNRHLKVLEDIVKNSLHDRINRILIFRDHHHNVSKLIK